MNQLAFNMLLIAQTTAGDGGQSTTGNHDLANRVVDLTVDPLRVLIEGLNRFDILNHPMQMTETLSQLHVVWAVIFVILGLISVMNGYQWHRWIVMIISFLVGLELGGFLGSSMAVSGVVAGSIGILVAIVAWPLMKYAIILCGALAGAFLGANLWTALGYPPDTHYAGAVIGFVGFGMLGFMAEKVVIVAMTCTAGAFLFMLGTISLMTRVDGWQNGLNDSFSSNTLIIPLVTLVIAVFGFVIQQGSAFSAGQKKPSAKPAAA